MSHALDMSCSIAQEGNDTFTITVEVRRCRSIAEANIVATWIRDSLKANTAALSTAFGGAHLESEVHQ